MFRFHNICTLMLFFVIHTRIRYIMSQASSYLSFSQYMLILFSVIHARIRYIMSQASSYLSFSLYMLILFFVIHIRIRYVMSQASSYTVPICIVFTVYVNAVLCYPYNVTSVLPLWQRASSPRGGGQSLRRGWEGGWGHCRPPHMRESYWSKDSSTRAGLID